MSGFWADGYWATGFWADGFWAGTDVTGVAIPDVVDAPTYDIDQATAVADLITAGLTSTIEPRPHPTITVGNVISCSPAVGTVVPLGSSVALRISTGPSPTGNATSIGSGGIGGSGLGKTGITDPTRLV